MVRRSQPTLYVDTNVFSILHFRGNEIQSLRQHLVTREWWANERRYFSLFTSIVTERELSRGDYQAKDAAIAEARRVNYLPVIRDILLCAARLLQHGFVPATEEADAQQLAFAMVNEIDYLLTWNHAHLANIHVQDRLTTFTEKWGWRAPLLVSPMDDSEGIHGTGHQEVR
jgi:hypothetical protein